MIENQVFYTEFSNSSYDLLKWVLKKFKKELPYNGGVVEFLKRSHYSTTNSSNYWKEFGVPNRIWLFLHKDLVIARSIGRIKKGDFESLEDLAEEFNNINRVYEFLEEGKRLQVEIWRKIPNYQQVSRFNYWKKRTEEYLSSLGFEKFVSMMDKDSLPVYVKRYKISDLLNREPSADSKDYDNSLAAYNDPTNRSLRNCVTILNYIGNNKII